MSPPASCFSGGLDSSVIASIAKDLAGAHLLTFCSGFDDGDQSAIWPLRHERPSTSALAIPPHSVTRDLFARRWPEMVSRLRSPPLHAQRGRNQRGRPPPPLRRLHRRAQAKAPTSSSAAMNSPCGRRGSGPAARRERAAASSSSNPTPGSARTSSPSSCAEVWTAAEHDTALAAFYEDEFAAIEAQPPIDAERHDEAAARVQHHLHSTSGSTSSASSNASTPRPCSRALRAARRWPICESPRWPTRSLSCKYEPNRGTAGTKIALRRAFADALPAEVVSRPRPASPFRSSSG